MLNLLLYCCMKFVNLPKNDRIAIKREIFALRSDLDRYSHEVAKYKNLISSAEFNVAKTSKKLSVLLNQFEDKKDI